jgi:hypothetical protein
MPHENLRWVLFEDISADPHPERLGHFVKRFCDPRTRLILHGGPEAPVGTVDPYDLEEWKLYLGMTDPASIPEGTRRWLETSWTPFALNGLETIAALLFGLAGEADEPQRLWIFFRGLAMACYEKKQSPSEFLKKVHNHYGDFVRFQCRGDYPFREAPFPICSVVYRFTSPDQLLAVGLLCDTSIFNSIFVMCTGKPTESEFFLEREIFGARQSVPVDLIMRTSITHVRDLIEGSFFVTEGWGEDEEDLALYVSIDKTLLVKNRILKFCSERGIHLELGGSVTNVPHP